MTVFRAPRGGRQRSFQALEAAANRSARRVRGAESAGAPRRTEGTLNARTIDAATLSSQGVREMTEPCSRKSSTAAGRRKAPINPSVKAWLDNVVVPVLVEQWDTESVPGVPA
jgi:hypothetical protein